MTVYQLIQALMQFDPDLEVCYPSGYSEEGSAGTYGYAERASVFQFSEDTAPVVIIHDDYSLDG